MVIQRNINKCFRVIKRRKPYNQHRTPAPLMWTISSCCQVTAYVGRRRALHQMHSNLNTLGLCVSAVQIILAITIHWSFLRTFSMGGSGLLFTFPTSNHIIIDLMHFPLGMTNMTDLTLNITKKYVYKHSR